jgi:hypothetical protein
MDGSPASAAFAFMSGIYPAYSMRVWTSVMEVMGNIAAGLCGGFRDQESSIFFGFHRLFQFYL